MLPVKNASSHVYDDFLPPSKKKPPSYILPHTDEAGDPYYIGHIYHRLTAPSWSQAVRETRASRTTAPYYNHIRQISQGWPYMQYLADFMDTTCAPPKAKFLSDQDKEKRAERVRVRLLEFNEDRPVKRTDMKTTAELRNTLENLSSNIDYRDTLHSDAHQRLFIVEDLSRDVIENLGHYLDIDPHFFRSHINDYLWYNTRDPWVELPDLPVFAMKREFFQMRYVQPRYFTSEESLQRARTEAGSFNVLRRVDKETDSFLKLDEPGSVVAMIRTKATLWVRSKDEKRPGNTAVLLLDPLTHEGFPLWGGYSNLAPHFYPPSSSASCTRPPRIPQSPFEDFTYWTEALSSVERSALNTDPRVFAVKALLLASANWRIALEYATTRITQIEWEVEGASFKLLPAGDGLDGCLHRLHRWRRVLPIYQEMVEATLFSVVDRSHPDYPCISSKEGSRPIEEIRPDFLKILSQIEKLRQRCESIVHLVGTLITIEESKKAVMQNGNLTRLTYLACVFIPMSFLSSLFSMTDDLTSLKTTFWIYFSIAVPLTALCLSVIVVLYSNRRILSRQA